MVTDRKAPGVPADDWLTISQAARVLELSSQRVDQLAREGLLPYENTALGRLFFVKDLDAFKAGREAKAAEKTADDADGAA